MKRSSLIVVLLLLLGAVQAQATNGQFYPVFPEPYGYAAVPVQLGWYNGTQAWHFCTTTNSIEFARARSLGFQYIPTLAPKLSSALVPRVMGGPIAANPMFLVTNFQNPPVFSTAPGQSAYSALWQVFYVTWLPGVTPRPITSAEPASPGNPAGLPGPSEADIAATHVVLDCPIVVLGPLACPGSLNAPGYIIPQAGGVDVYRKFVFLPGWLVYCQDPVTKRASFAISQITDVSDPALATVLGANLAPGLLNLPDSDTSDFYVMRGPKPLTQLPVVSDCANGTGFRNTNLDYSPVMRYVIVQRNIPPYALVKSPDYVQLLLSNGGLTLLGNDIRINTNTFPD